MVLSLRQKTVNSQTFHSLRTAWINNKATEQIQARPGMNTVLFVTPRSRNTANKYTYVCICLQYGREINWFKAIYRIKQFHFAIKSSSFSISSSLPFKKQDDFSTQNSFLLQFGMPKNYLKSTKAWKNGSVLYHRERILETSTLSCNEEEEEITKPPTR